MDLRFILSSLLILTAESGNITALVRYADSTWNCDGAAPPCIGCNHVPSGSWQNPYGCAPFVAHTLAAGGFISLSDCGSLDAYSSYSYGGKAYDLNVVSHQDPICSSLCLMDLLLDMGWKETSTVTAGTVCAVTGTDGPYTHIVVGVGAGVIDAHNAAHFHAPISNYETNLCLDSGSAPPPPPPPSGPSCAGKPNGWYCGDDLTVNGVTNTLYLCSSGVVTQTKPCAFACAIVPGKDDICVPGTCANVVDGNFCGDDGISGQADVLYRCIGHASEGAWFCPNGCKIVSGANDVCK